MIATEGEDIAVNKQSSQQNQGSTAQRFRHGGYDGVSADLMTTSYFTASSSGNMDNKDKDMIR
jgi:hypothetical protein